MNTNQPSEYFVVSDLHIAEGSSRGPFYLGTENFEVDQQFHSFLKHIHNKSPSVKELIINGDFVDFIRITSVPESEDDYTKWQQEVQLVFPNKNVAEFNISCSERKYGLKSNDYKSIWKLYLALKGHTVFFKALEWWLKQDNVLVITEGNHDPEWYWPKLREYFNIKLTGQANSNKIIYRTEYDNGQASYTPVPNLHIEHGHLVDDMNKTEKDRVLPKLKDQLTLPRGSFFNRYIINHAEMAFPFIDNLDPKGTYVLKILKNNPVSVFGFTFKHVPYLWKMLEKFKKDYVKKILEILVLLIAAGALFYYLYQKDTFGFISHPIVAFILSLGLFNIQSLINGLKSLVGIKAKTYQDKIIEKAKTLKVNTIIVGHNHNPQVIESDGVTYYNSGTWVRGHNLSPKNLKIGHRLTFIKFTNHTDVNLRIWDSSLNSDIPFFNYKQFDL